MAQSSILSKDEDVSVMCSAEPPYNVTWASQGWYNLCGYEANEIIGRSLRCLQGVATDQAAVATMMQAFRSGACPQGAIALVNYDKQRRPFSHTVSVEPVADDKGRITHWHARSSQISSLHRAARVPVWDAAVVACDLDIDMSVEEMATGFVLEGCDSEALVAVTTDALSIAEADGEADGEGDGHCDGGAPVALWGSPHDGCQLRWLSCGAPHEVAPFPVVWASPDWLDICGFRLVEIVGRNLRCIQGTATDRTAVAALMHAVRTQAAVRDVKLVNYDKSHRPFEHVLSLAPVQSEEGGVAYLRATSVAVRRLWGRPAPAFSGDSLRRGDALVVTTTPTEAPTTVAAQ